MGSEYPTAASYHVQLYRVADGELVAHYSGNTGSETDIAWFFRTTSLLDERFLVSRLVGRRSFMVCELN